MDDDSKIPPPVPPRNNAVPNFQTSSAYGTLQGVPYGNSQSPWSPYHQQYGTGGGGYYTNSLRYFFAINVIKCNSY